MRRVAEAANPRKKEHHRLYGARWRRLRLTFLRQAPVCAECWRAGRHTAATEVDHIEPHRGDRALFWDQTNWQALCKPCHSRKTAREVLTA